jgi:hypothetical protein
MNEFEKTGFYIRSRVLSSTIGIPVGAIDDEALHLYGLLTWPLKVSGVANSPTVRKFDSDLDSAQHVAAAE